MKTKTSVLISSIELLLCFCTHVKATTTITGNTPVCFDTASMYTATGHTAACTYHWSVTPSGAATLSGSTTATTTIFWKGAGTYTVSVNVDSGGSVVGSATYSVTVMLPPSVYITTSNRVACESFDTAHYGTDPPPLGYILSDTAGCIKVCASNTAIYYAMGAGSTDTIRWIVTGGTIIGRTDDDTVTVQWGAANPAGQILVTDKNTGGCTGIYKVCINIIALPHAAFVMDTVTIPSIGPDTVCLNTNVAFTDMSTPSDSTSTITKWFWIFGDGNFSSQQNPTHRYTTSSSGYDTVREVVTNACGCTDTFSVLLFVKTQSGPHLYCASVACEGDSVTYYTTDVCGTASYYWSWDLTHAHAISPTPYEKFPSITLVWDLADANGYGTISLSDSGCTGVCTGETTLRIPIIQTSPIVSGPTTSELCTGTPYIFSIPLWPGTRYNWGVINKPSAIINSHHENKVVVLFNDTGTFTIHVWYQNALKLCGSDVKFSVKVVKPDTIIGPTGVCLGATTPNYYLKSLKKGLWTLTGPGSFTDTATTDTFRYTFTTPGIYTLGVVGHGYCPPAPIYIHIDTSGPTIASITGPTTICKNLPYTYTVKNDAPGFVWRWHVAGGKPSTIFGDSITITWTNVGPGLDSVIVERRDLSGSACVTATKQLLPNPSEYVVHPHVVGNPGHDTVCANGIVTYIDTMQGADATTWGITPDTLGSITGSYYTNNVTVHWNNISGSSIQTAKVYVSEKKCALAAVRDTLYVRVLPNPNITVTGDHYICRGASASFSAVTGSSIPPASSYTWSFGDVGSYSGGTTNNHHYYPTKSAGTDSITYVVSVTANGSDSSCPVLGKGYTKVEVYAGTFPNIHTSSKLSYCGTTPHVTFSSTVDNVYPGSTVTYAWYRVGTSGSVGSSSTYTTGASSTADTGTYYLVTDDATACPQTSNTLTIVNTGVCGSCPTAPDLTLSNLCNGKLLAIGGTGGTSPVFDAPGGSSSLSTSGYSDTITYTDPGYYQVTLTEVISGCGADSIVVDSVPLITSFYFDWTCPPGAGANYIVNFHDNSKILSGWSGSYGWNAHNVSSGADSNGSGSIWSPHLPPGTYVVTDTAKVSSGSANQACYISKTVVVPGYPTLSINAVTNPLCAAVPMSFSLVPGGANPPGMSTYLWSFGDKSYSALGNPQRAYTYDPGIAGSPPDTFRVALNVTDTLGCTYSVSVIDTVYPNGLSGIISGSSFACAGGIVPLSYSNTGSTSPFSYLWSNGTTTAIDTINMSGAYKVDVFDTHQCHFATNSFGVTVLTPKALNIDGSHSVCYPGDVILSDYLSINNTGTDLYLYQWYRNDTLLTGATGNVLDDAGRGAATYRYRLIVEDTVGGGSCYDTSGYDTVIVHAKPSAPVIGSLSATVCKPYTLRMSVSSPTSTSFYNWSNGTADTADTVHSGGTYRVWVTDKFGCQNYTDTIIPNSPDNWLAWFPTGCYTLCYQQLPDTLYGPPGIFYTWNWLHSGTSIAPITSSHNTLVIPLPLDTLQGYYQLSLSNLYCPDTTDTLNLTTSVCGGCRSVIERINPPYYTDTCDTTNPAGYIVHVILTGTVGSTAIVGFNIGPVTPFNIMLTSSPDTLTFYFSTLDVPAPATALMEVKTDQGLGHPCVDTMRITLPDCSSLWPSERLAHSNSSNGGAVNNLQKKNTGMVVYPNPANDEIYVNYIFGGPCDCKRNIVIYSVTGRELYSEPVNNITGTLSFPTTGFIAGSYIVRMEENGKAVQTAHVSITH